VPIHYSVGCIRPSILRHVVLPVSACGDEPVGSVGFAHELEDAIVVKSLIPPLITTGAISVAALDRACFEVSGVLLLPHSILASVALRVAPSEHLQRAQRMCSVGQQSQTLCSSVPSAII
jgi:hypothetical protein